MTKEEFIKLLETLDFEELRCATVSYYKKKPKKNLSYLEESDDEILNEIYDTCSKCPNQYKCPEEECTLYRIEQIVLKEGEKQWDQTRLEKRFSN